jgi:hypothetical protein
VRGMSWIAGVTAVTAFTGCQGNHQVSRDSAASSVPSDSPADSLALTAAPGVEVWFTDTRQAHDSAGNACEERVLEIRRDGRRIPVPLLYTGSLPRLINDSTIEAPIWLHCRPGNLYRVNLHTGYPTRAQ